MSELLIRTATPAVAPALLEIYRYYVENTAITFEYDVPSAEEFSARIAHTLERYPYFVAVVGDEIVGYAYASSFKDRAAYDWAVETSIYVKHGVTRRGIGKALYAALEQALALQNITNLNACIGCPELADEHLDFNSVQFHEHMGYSTVGKFTKCGYKFGKWYSMVWMEKFILPHLETPPAVRTFGEIRPELSEKYGIK